VKIFRAKENDEIYIFKVQLYSPFENEKYLPYRKIAIPSNFTLFELARSIIDSFDFNFDYCFGFYDNIDNEMESEIYYDYFWDPDSNQNKSTLINEAFKKINQKFLFMIDYGDCWKFTVFFEKIIKPDTKEIYPLTVESHGEAPKEYHRGEIDFIYENEFQFFDADLVDDEFIDDKDDNNDFDEFGNYIN